MVFALGEQTPACIKMRVCDGRVHETPTIQPYWPRVDGLHSVYIMNQTKKPRPNRRRQPRLPAMRHMPSPAAAAGRKCLHSHGCVFANGYPLRIPHLELGGKQCGLSNPGQPRLRNPAEHTRRVLLVDRNEKQGADPARDVPEPGWE